MIKLEGLYGEDEKEPSHEQWGAHVYELTDIITSIILIILYFLTIFKACKGTQFRFILILQVLLIISNIGAIGAAVLAHVCSVLTGEIQTDPSKDDEFLTCVRWNDIFVVLRDASLCLAIWIFSFRYWVTSFVIPWQLRSHETPKGFVVLSLILFIFFAILNILTPVGYAYWGAMINSSLVTISFEEV